MTNPRRVPEKVVQQHIVRLLVSIGARVYELGHKRSKGQFCKSCQAFVPNNDFSTRQTPGIPDVFAFVPNRAKGTWHALWVECKAEDGTLSDDQHKFASFCGDVGVWHVTGGLNEVIAHLVGWGVISERNVPHYRLQNAEARP